MMVFRSAKFLIINFFDNNDPDTSNERNVVGLWWIQEGKDHGMMHTTNLLKSEDGKGDKLPLGEKVSPNLFKVSTQCCGPVP